MATATATKATTAKPEIKPDKAPTPPPKPATLKTPVDVTFLLMNNTGDFKVHVVGCSVYKRDKARSAYKGLDDYQIDQVVNRREVIMELWDDQIRESYTADDGDDYASASWAWLAKNGYVQSVDFHSCLDGLPQAAKAGAKAASESIKKATKQELATRVAEAAATMLTAVFDENLAEDSDEATFLAALLAAFGSEDQARQCVAQWLHGMPVDRDRWYNSGLPIPQRSDWADYVRPEDRATGPTPA
jgi:hypothetical protein